jgi:hypothetical protein
LGWQKVDAVASGTALHQLSIAAAAADIACQPFRSAAGAWALLVPIGPLVDGAIPGIAVRNAPSVTDVLFVDPAGGSRPADLLEVLGEGDGQVLVALPDDTDAPGLAPQQGRITVTVGDGAPTVYRLHRAGHRAELDVERSGQRITPADDPRALGESEDVLGRRAKWFQTRHGSE